MSDPAAPEHGGTGALNRALQAALNPPAHDKRQKAWGDKVFRTGDRVMQIRNNYDVLWARSDGVTGSGIFNGDVGVVEEIDPSGEMMTVRFDDRTATYVSDMLGELEPAFAVTVHKARPLPHGRQRPPAAPLQRPAVEAAAGREGRVGRVGSHTFSF